MVTPGAGQGIFNQDKYKDITLFLILIPLINALNYYLTYPVVSFTWYTLITFTIDTLQGYAAWLGVRAVILRLDRVLPYTEKPLKRIVIQLLLTTVTGLVIIIFLTELVNRIAADHPVPASFYLFVIFIFIIWIFVINGIYIGLHYYSEWKQSETQRSKDKEIRKEGFMVNQGKQNLSIPFPDIFCLFVDGEYVILFTTGAKKYFLSQSLDACEQLLPGEWFFRLNRQFIAHRKSIQGFKRVENGKLDVLIHPFSGIPESIQVSRTKAAAFKAWFQGE